MSDTTNADQGPTLSPDVQRLVDLLVAQTPEWKQEYIDFFKKAEQDSAKRSYELKEDAQTEIERKLLREKKRDDYGMPADWTR